MRVMCWCVLACAVVVAVLGPVDVKAAENRTEVFVASDWQWIIVETHEGGLSKITTDMGRIPVSHLQRLMPTKDKRIPTKDEIKEMAQRLGLFDRTTKNPHLRFKDGDIAYWSEQDQEAWEITLEFLARRCLLLAADNAGAFIPTQGDLSHWASSVYGALYQKIRITWEKTAKE